MATKAQPRGERTCLACEAVFMGTPKATRCDTCRAEGRKVPRDVQRSRSKAPLKPAKPPKPPKPAPVQYDKTCLTCGDQFTTRRAKAVRCPPCASADMPVRVRRCCECGSSYNLAHDDHSSIRCEPCAELLGFDQIQPNPEQLEAERQEQRRERRKGLLARQAAWLDEREARTPKGKRMTTAVRSKPIGSLWMQVCAHDGAAHSLTYAGATADLTEHEKLALLTSYVKLRLKGYRSEQIERLCPVALLQEDTQGALSDLPEVTESDPEDDPNHDPYAGLTSTQIEEITDFTERQKRRTEAVVLGLA